MPIFYEDSSINNAILDEESLSLVNCNGIQVFPDAIYQFPCDTAYLVNTSESGMHGFYLKFGGQLNGYLAIYAFSYSTDEKTYCYYSNSFAATTMNTGDIALLFPFYIQVQSVTIMNCTSMLKNDEGYKYGGLMEGTINLVEPLSEGSEEYKYKNQISSTIDSDSFVKYVDFVRTTDADEALSSGFNTTHSNPEMANTWTRWVVLNPTKWVSGKAHRIGDIRIKFKANQSDIKAWNDTYSSDNMQFIPIID